MSASGSSSGIASTPQAVPQQADDGTQPVAAQKSKANKNKFAESAGAIFGIASTLYGAHQQAEADKTQSAASLKQGAYQKQIYDANAVNANRESQDTLRIGDVNANKLQTGVKGLMGQQRASYSGQGVVVGQGSSADAASDASFQSSVDAETIRTNAWKQSLGLQAEAQTQRTQGQWALDSARGKSQAYETEANTSLVTGGLRAASQYMDYKNRSNSTYRPSAQ